MRISDWSSDVCSSDLDDAHRRLLHRYVQTHEMRHRLAPSSLPEVRSDLSGNIPERAAPSRSMITRSRRDTPSFHPATRKPTECYRPLRDLDTVDIAAAMRQLDQPIR